MAAELYTKGLVKKVLLSKVDDGPSVGIGALPGHTESNRKVLIRLGVPKSAIETFGTSNKNTMEEAVALRAWTSDKAVAVLIIPTEVFSSRRVRWAFRREFAGTTVHIEVPSFNPASDYTRAEWWKTATGVIVFQNEVLKYLYYHVMY